MAVRRNSAFMSDASRSNPLSLGALIGPDADYGAADATLDVGRPVLDSRKAVAGDVFFALAGAKANGAQFIADAVAHGARAVVGEGERPDGLDPKIAYVRVGNARRAVALAAARAYPRQPGTIAAVTGTSGKTSVAAFTRQIWQFEWPCQRQPRHARRGGALRRGLWLADDAGPDRTAPHARHAGRRGVSHLCLEASSHGLDQHRLDGVRLSAGAFTNLSRDHLDYHPTMEAYLAAKMRLFSELVPRGGGAAVWVDTDDGSHAAEIAAHHSLEVLGIGGTGAGITLLERVDEGLGQRLLVEVAGKQRSILLPLVGAFQAANALVAAGLAILTGTPAADALNALPKLEGVPGRLELVGTRNSAGVFVDYAHKPDALATALAALRPYVTGRLIVVFGCGGDRDRGKRPIMGRIASDKADLVIVTDDNPRSENPAAIRKEILAAATGAREIGDRAEAIRTGIGLLQAGDVLLIAGKGHETGQIVGDRTLPFSDRDCAVEALGGRDQ